MPDERFKCEMAGSFEEGLSAVALFHYECLESLDFGNFAARPAPEGQVTDNPVQASLNRPPAMPASR
jgi:hypothetical protein